MKKLIVVLFLFFVLVSNINTRKEFSLKDYVSGDYAVYTNKKVNDSSIFLGTCFMSKNADTSNDIIGESIKTSNIELVTLLKELDAEIISTEYLECGAVVISAFSQKINDRVKVGGQNINLQIAAYTDYSIIGWPLILGSF